MSPANLGALFRLADAMGVEKLIFDSTINTASHRMLKTSRSTFSRVIFNDNVDLTSEIKSLKSSGFIILGLEITSNSRPIKMISQKVYDKWFLLIGNEQNGIHESLLDSLDFHVHIPMFGNNSSMNVIQATAMALYELRRDE